MNKEELKFKIRQNYYQFQIALIYFLKEPFYEIKRLISGYYNSLLLFWFSVIVFIMLWNQNVGGAILKIAGLLIIISYFFMFYKSEKWKEYYTKEYMEGKKIE